MSIRDVVRRGYGNALSDGSIAAVVTRGYTPDQTVQSGSSSSTPAGAILLLLLFTELQPR